MPLSVALEPREPGADAGSTQNRATEALVRAYFSVHYEHPPVGTAWWQIDQRLDQWIHGFRWLSAVTHRGRVWPGLNSLTKTFGYRTRSISAAIPRTNACNAPLDAEYEHAPANGL